MAKLKEYAMTTFKSRVSMIFGTDGTLGDYPAYVLPDQPEDGATIYNRKIWKLGMVDYNKNIKTLEEEKGNLYGAMLGQMSESSKMRVSEVQTGIEAENEFEPRKLMQAILVTHIGDSTLGVQHQMYMIIQRYNNLVMGQHDNFHPGTQWKQRRVQVFLHQRVEAMARVSGSSLPGISQI